jgi:hypothetical protein
MKDHGLNPFSPWRAALAAYLDGKKDALEPQT